MGRFIDLTGQRFGKLTVIKRADDYVSPKGQRQTQWLCRCDCGNIHTASYSNLKHGDIQSCGSCLIDRGKRGKFSTKDITGMRFGNLVAIEPTSRRSGSYVIWICKCDCGKTVERSIHYLSAKDSFTKSCGCQRNKAAKMKTVKAAAKAAEDYCGLRVGKLILISPTEKRKDNSTVWKCLCDCGNYTEVSQHSLLRTNRPTRSCGCMMNHNILKSAGGNSANKKIVFLDGDTTNRDQTNMLMVSKTAANRAHNMIGSFKRQIPDIVKTALLAEELKVLTEQ